MKNFFFRSDLLDHETLRKLSHIKPNWEITWNDDTKLIEIEDDSFGEQLNKIFDELDNISKSNQYIEDDYHKYEDILANYAKEDLNWDINKINGRWSGADYCSIIENGGFKDLNQKDLLLSLYGRIKRSKSYNIYHYDEIDNGHREMIANLIAVIIYHNDMYT